MPQPYHYPPLDEDFIFTLKMLLKAVKIDNLAHCPYAPEEQDFLSTQLAEKRTSNFLNLTPEEKAVWTEQESANLYDELKFMEKDFHKLEVNEKIQTIKTRQSLLEKLTTIQERSVNMQLMLQFQEEVMNLLSETLTETQLEDFLKLVERT